MRSHDLVCGSAFAPGPEALRKHLWRRLGLHLKRKRVLPFWRYRGALKRDVPAIFSQLAQLLDAHMPLSSALDLLVQTMPTPVSQAALKHLHDAVGEGQTLHQAMADLPQVFAPIMVQMVAMGEQTGELAVAMSALASHLTQQAQCHGQLRQALVYPGVMLGAFCLVVTFLWLCVLPGMGALFDQMHATVPTGTRRLLASSAWVRAHADGLLPVLGLSLLCVVVWVKQRGVGLPQCLQRLPLVGTILWRLQLCLQLGLLHLIARSQMPWPQGLALIAAQPGTYQNDWQRCHHALREGSRLHEALQQHRLFDQTLCGCLATAERSGQVGLVVGHSVAQHAAQSQSMLQHLGQRLEPILTMGIGLGIGAAMVWLYLPLLQLGEAVW